MIYLFVYLIWVLGIC